MNNLAVYLHMEPAQIQAKIWKIRAILDQGKALNADHSRKRENSTRFSNNEIVSFKLYSTEDDLLKVLGRKLNLAEKIMKDIQFSAD